MFAQRSNHGFGHLTTGAEPKTTPQVRRLHGRLPCLRVFCFEGRHKGRKINQTIFFTYQRPEWIDFFDVASDIFPQTGLPVRFYLRKKRLDTLVGALCCVGRGFGRAGRAGLGWAWDLAARVGGWWARCAVLGAESALAWVGRGIWPCWACWAASRSLIASPKLNLRFYVKQN